MKTKPFNIYEFLKKRPLSPSAISSFCGEYGSPEKWYKSYILNERQGSPETEFGSIIDKKIQNDPKFLPTLPRYPIMQHEMNVVYNKKIRMTGFADGLDLNKFLLADYKTGREAWTKARADSTDQLTAYLFFIYIAKKIPPEKFRCFIHWIPTTKVEYGNFDVKIDFRDNPPVPITFETKRTMGDILQFGAKVQRVVMEMQKYVLSKTLNGEVDKIN